MYVLFPNSLFHLDLCNTVGQKQRDIFPRGYFEAHYKVQHFTKSKSKSESEYNMTNHQLASLSWCQASVWGPRPDCSYCQTVTGLLMWGAHSDERTGLSFTIAARPRQRSHSQVWVPWNSWPCFTVSNLRLPKPGGPGLHIYIPQEQGGPVLNPVSS
jgi:hypothetical protein